MGSNGIVTETAHLNVDKKKFDESYDRIFKAVCIMCSEIDSKSKMVKDSDEHGSDIYFHRECP